MNDAGGVEQTVAARVRAAWMKSYGAETWAMKAGVLQRLLATERRMLRMICRVTLKDMVENTVIVSRAGVDDLEEYLSQKRLRWLR